MTGCNYVDPCPNAPVSPEDEEQVLACSIVDCAGADFTASILRTILLAGIYDDNIQLSVLRTVGLEYLPIQEIVNLVEEETIRHASDATAQTARAAPTSSNGKDHIAAESPPTPRRRSAAFPDDGYPPQAVGRKCNNNVSDNISCRGDTHDTQPCERGRCHGPNTRPPESYDGGSGDRSQSRDASTPSARISAARITRGGHDDSAPADPRLEVLLSFKTPGGPIKFRVKDAVAHSGAQITVIPADMLNNKDIAIRGLRRSSVILRAANNVTIDVLGVVDANISPLSPCGKRFFVSLTSGSPQPELEPPTDLPTGGPTPRRCHGTSRIPANDAHVVIPPRRATIATSPRTSQSPSSGRPGACSKDPRRTTDHGSTLCQRKRIADCHGPRKPGVTRGRIVAPDAPQKTQPAAGRLRNTATTKVTSSQSRQEAVTTTEVTGSQRRHEAVVVLKTWFQFSDWIVTRYLDVFQPKETEFGVKNIKKVWDRAPPRP